jgi:hypothetical protein
LMVFCAIGLFSIPGEMGMMKVAAAARQASSLAVISSSQQPQQPQQEQLLVMTFISSMGVVLSMVTRGVGLWTSLQGWKRLLRSRDKEIHLVDDSTSADREVSGDVGLTTSTDNRDNMVEKLSSSALPPPSQPPNVDISSDSLAFKRMFTVSKIHRNQNALFYRNLFLLVLGGAGSNMMEAIFRCRVSIPAAGRMNDGGIPNRWVVHDVHAR